MSKIMVNVAPKQIKMAFEGLPVKERIKLMEELEKETLSLRWRQIFKDIDRRLRRFPISSEEIFAEIAAYRKEKHAKGRH